MKYTKTLVIGDAHDDPNQSQERFEALGNFIVHNQPDHIVQIGDWLNLDSISFHNKGRPLIQEGRRIADDLESAQRAYDLTMGPTVEYNASMSAHKKAKYSPRKLWLEGNHEHRVSRYLEGVPELQGFLPETGLVKLDRDWELLRYKEYGWIEGCMFTHAAMNPATNSPLGGKYVTKRALENTSDTIVFGHNHVRQMDSIQRADANKKDGKRVDSICVGGYFDYTHDYVSGVHTTINWWCGLIILTHTAPGEVDIESLNIDRIKQEYL